MNLRNHLQTLKDSGKLVAIKKPVSKRYEIAAILKQMEPKTVLFENVSDSGFRVVGNLCCTKAQFAEYFKMAIPDIIPALSRAIENPTPPHLVEAAPCQEIVVLEPDLANLPIPFHFPGDGGPFITAGVAITSHPVYGQNMDFHRCMPFSPTEMAVRVVQGRHFHTYLEELGQVDVAICVGNTPNILAAGAISVGAGHG